MCQAYEAEAGLMALAGRRALADEAFARGMDAARKGKPRSANPGYRNWMSRAGCEKDDWYGPLIKAWNSGWYSVVRDCGGEAR